MPAIAFVVPGSLTAISGGSIYDRRIVDGLRSRGWLVDVHEAASAGEASRALAAIQSGTVTVVDGLLFAAMADAAQAERGRLNLVPIVHLPRALTPGLDAAAAAAFEAGERQALGAASLAIATGADTRRTLQRYGMPADRVVVVEPGVDPASAASGSGTPTTALLCVATVNAGKGHSILIEALADHLGHSWHLTCVGALDRDPASANRLRSGIVRAGLEDRVRLAGLIDPAALGAEYDRADAFVLATAYETYGMAVAEALAHGLPVISTRTGAIPKLVGDDAGLLAEPGDLRTFSAALGRFLGDADLRNRLRAGAGHARLRARTWDATVDEMVSALGRVTRD